MLDLLKNPYRLAAGATVVASLFLLAGALATTYYSADIITSVATDSGDAYAYAADDDSTTADLYGEAYDGNANAHATWRKDFTVGTTGLYDIYFRWEYEGEVSEDEASDIAFFLGNWRLWDETEEDDVLSGDVGPYGPGSYDTFVVRGYIDTSLDSTHEYYWELYARAAAYSDNGEAISDFDTAGQVEWKYLSVN